MSTPFKALCASALLLGLLILTGANYPAGANQRHQAFKITAANLNSAATDAGTFTGLPSRYLIDRLTINNASVSLTTATIDLRTAASGGGTALVSAFAPTALTASSKIVAATLATAATTDVGTSTTLYLRCVTAQGVAATADAILEVTALQ